MADEILGDRRRALEEEFFKRENAKLRAELDAKKAREAGKGALRESSGIQDEAVLDALVAADIDLQTLAALSLVPLVEVAWADGKIEAKERAAILRAAEGVGIAAGTAAHELLEFWLAEPPPDALLFAWENYVRALVEGMDPARRTALKNDVLGRARGVADAAGGFLGLTSRISDDEQDMLDRLEQAFE